MTHILAKIPHTLDGEWVSAADTFFAFDLPDCPLDYDGRRAILGKMLDVPATCDTILAGNAGEDGIHQMTRGNRENRKGKRKPVERDVVRVEVLPAPLGETDFAADKVRCEVNALSNTTGRLIGRLKHDVRLFHVATMTALRAWLDGPKADAIDRIRPLLQARVENARVNGVEIEPTRTPMVRRYTLGPATLVRDVRSGRATGRLDQVLDGYLEPFLQPPPTIA
ncbi:MAG TPA: hypothetical protein VE988_05650 [Gemmataceae bacterium]|nr:hypothetical protein [Gemmataceae bacterium]